MAAFLALKNKYPTTRSKARTMKTRTAITINSASVLLDPLPSPVCAEAVTCASPPRPPSGGERGGDGGGRGGGGDSNVDVIDTTGAAVTLALTPALDKKLVADSAEAKVVSIPI